MNLCRHLRIFLLFWNICQFFAFSQFRTHSGIMSIAYINQFLAFDCVAFLVPLECLGTEYIKCSFFLWTCKPNTERWH